MRDSLILPVIFLGLLLACFVAFTLGYLIYLWDIQYVPTDPPNLKWVVSAAPGVMRRVFVPSTIVALFLLIMRTARKPGIAVLSVLLTLIVSGAVLYFGLTYADSVLGSQNPEAVRHFNPLTAQTFNQTQAATLYPEVVQGDSLGATLVVTPSKKPSFEFQRRGDFQPAEWSVQFSNLSVPIRPRNPALSSEIAPRGFLASLFADIGALDSYLKTMQTGSLTDFAIALGGVLLFSVSCIAFAWFTKWPVVNIVVVAICFRAVFWLFSLFSSQIATDAFDLVIPKPYMPVAPSIGLGALGLLIIIWNIFFVRPPAR